MNIVKMLKAISKILFLDNLKNVSKDLILNYIPEEKEKIDVFFWEKQLITELDNYNLEQIYLILRDYKDKIASLQENKKEEKIERIEEIGLFMKKIVEDVNNWEKEPIKGYIELKRIEKWVANYIEQIKDLAYNDFENWEKNDLPYWYTWAIQSRINIKYDQDEIYKKEKEILKAREDLLKTVVENNKKWLTTNDEDWLLIECPEYSYSSSLVIKKK